jgi:hypothetical protein
MMRAAGPLPADLGSRYGASGFLARFSTAAIGLAKAICCSGDMRGQAYRRWDGDRHVRLDARS